MQHGWFGGDYLSIVGECACPHGMRWNNYEVECQTNYFSGTNLLLVVLIPILLLGCCCCVGIYFARKMFSWISRQWSLSYQVFFVPKFETLTIWLVIPKDYICQIATILHLREAENLKYPATCPQPFRVLWLYNPTCQILFCEIIFYEITIHRKYNSCIIICFNY